MSSAHRYTDFELRAMMQDVESDLVERKESLRGDAPTSIREAVCAFANDLPDHRRPAAPGIQRHPPTPLLHRTSQINHRLADASVMRLPISDQVPEQLVQLAAD